MAMLFKNIKNRPRPLWLASCKKMSDTSTLHMDRVKHGHLNDLNTVKEVWDTYAQKFNKEN